MRRLTVPQRDTLVYLSERPRPMSDTYRPLQILIERGLVERKKMRLSDMFVITPAGREALANAERSHG